MILFNALLKSLRACVLVGTNRRLTAYKTKVRREFHLAPLMIGPMQFMIEYPGLSMPLLFLQRMDGCCPMRQHVVICCSSEAQPRFDIQRGRLGGRLLAESFFQCRCLGHSPENHSKCVWEQWMVNEILRIHNTLQKICRFLADSNFFSRVCPSNSRTPKVKHVDVAALCDLWTAAHRTWDNGINSEQLKALKEVKSSRQRDQDKPSRLAQETNASMDLPKRGAMKSISLKSEYIMSAKT